MRPMHTLGYTVLLCVTGHSGQGIRKSFHGSEYRRVKVNLSFSHSEVQKVHTPNLSSSYCVM